MSSSSKPIAVTCGDPAGVGPEIIEAIVSDGLDIGVPLAVIGPAMWLAKLKPAKTIDLQRIEIGDAGWRFEPGFPNDEAARCALKAMEVSAQGCKDGRFQAVATGPISKANCVKVGYAFPGQTEFYADRWGGKPTMAFVGEQLNVVLATWHIPFRDVPDSLDFETIEIAVDRAFELGKRLGIDSPRVGVCGLNPHAGEDGILGLEEKDSLNPILSDLTDNYPGLGQCLPADTLFARATRGDFDVVVAMYHDQGLGPLKTLEFDRAVNVSLGLPFVRTSPDHGTGYDIAGKGLASATSFKRAIELAASL